ncbi:galactokinase [Corynebacterium macginleyi]|uniref:galactokinase family protein n=1 Tax=Corynebacterium macginleyi TaxID=38290 RepID=UPI00190CDDF8|nr:galactokinase family protein [Corynebacterium macginleyi]MBK4139311.1 galactokinase [Corynebacterium macginleyi]
MPLWSTPESPIAARVAQQHASIVGTDPTHTASAPGTWPLMGEHIDHYGGIVAASLSDLRAAAAVSLRTDGIVAVHYIPTRGEPVHDSIGLQEVATLAAAQQATTDSEGQPVIPPAPEGGLAARIGGIVHTMINRQLLSRETAGADITIVNDIPADIGLGAASAADVATALALMGPVDNLDAPLRVRVAEVCTQAVTTFAHQPALRARHTAALRSSGDGVCIIDYADGSVTHAPHVVDQDVTAFAVAVPGGNAEEQSQAISAIRQRQQFIDDACHSFGTESLRLLPDAQQRVVEWLKAVHKVYGEDGRPSITAATEWMAFYAEENTRVEHFVRYLRSHRRNELFPIVLQSQASLTNIYGFDSAEKIAELVTVRGALAARSAHAGLSNAVIAYVPSNRATNFAADLADDGFLLVTLAAGEPAKIED